VLGRPRPHLVRPLLSSTTAGIATKLKNASIKLNESAKYRLNCKSEKPATVSVVTLPKKQTGLIKLVAAQMKELDRRTDARTDVHTDGRTHGQTDGQRNMKTDRKRQTKIHKTDRYSKSFWRTIAKSTNNLPMMESNNSRDKFN